jgi:hypothetical protein
MDAHEWMVTPTMRDEEVKQLPNILCEERGLAAGAVPHAVQNRSEEAQEGCTTTGLTDFQCLPTPFALIPSRVV